MTHDRWPRRLATTQIVLCAAGVVVAAILTSFHFSAEATAALCTAAGGCETVNTSSYSTVAGIPIALIGLGGYVIIGALAFISTRDWTIGEKAPLAVFGFSLIGVIYSAYLTYLELFVIHAVCLWCVASALLMTAIWVISLVGLLQRRQLDAVEADA